MSTQGSPKRVQSTSESSIHVSSATWANNLIPVVQLAQSITKPFPFAEGVCESVNILLEQIAKIQSNEESLKELADDAVNVVNTVTCELEVHEGEVDPDFQVTCNKLKRALDKIVAKLKRHHEPSSGWAGCFRRFMTAQSLNEQIAGYRATIEQLKGEFMLATTVGTRLEASTIRRNLVEVHNVTKSTGETLTTMNQNIQRENELRQAELQSIQKTLQSRQEAKSLALDLGVEDHSRGHVFQQTGGSLVVEHGAKIRHRRPKRRHRV